MLAKHAEDYRIEYNEIRPHEAIAWNRAQAGALGLANRPSRHFFRTNPANFLTRDITGAPGSGVPGLDG
jgi:putative transposase